MEIRFCKKKEIPRLQEFIKDYVSESHLLARDSQFLSWQYPAEFLECVQEDEVSILIAVKDNEICGLLGLIGFDLNDRGSLSQGVWLSNWFVAESYRNGSLGLALLRHLDSLQINFLGTIGHNQNSHKVFQAYKYEMKDDLPRCVGVFNKTKCFEFFNPDLGNNSNKALDEFFESLLVKLVNPKNDLQITSWKDSYKWDESWRRKFSQNFIGVERSAAYLKWRYVNHPIYHYEIFTALNSNNDLQGIAVLRIETASNQHKVARIVEFIASPVAVKQLSYHVLNFCKDQDVAFCDFSCTKRNIFQPFLDQNLREIQSNDPFVFPTRLNPVDFNRTSYPIALTYQVKGTRQNILGHENLYFTKSDADMDRPR